MLVPRIISRNAHHMFAEILPAKEADEGPWRIQLDKKYTICYESRV